MAKVITGIDGLEHLVTLEGTSLCGDVTEEPPINIGTLTCPKCAAIALYTMELVTKAEKREWRKL